jgi:membrane protein DedA with SNARE-associated domain
MPTLETVIQILQSYGLLLLFPIAVVEGPIATIIAGYLASRGYFNIYAVYFVVVLADLVGDTIWYLLGRFGHRLILMRWGPRFGVSEERLAALEKHFQVRGGRTLLIGKLSHAAGFMILLAAGASRMSFGTFIWYNILGTIPKSLFFLIIGYTFGYAYNQIDSYIFQASISIFVAAVVAGSYWFARRERYWA